MKILTLILAISFISDASARTEAEASPQLECGKILNLSGSVSILDSERRDFRETRVGGNIFCGDWISTEEGFVVLDFKHEGKITLGSGTFFQVLDPAAGSNLDHDHFVLYRGDIYFEGSKKTNPVRMITPNSRVDLKDSKSVVSFLEESHSTQVISIDGVLGFENRFLKHTPWKVERGYLSTMTQGQDRVLPGKQMTAEAKSLEAKLKLLSIPKETRKSIVDYVTMLGKRKLIVKLGDFSKKKEETTEGPTSERKSGMSGGRSPASAPETYSSVEHKAVQHKASKETESREDESKSNPVTHPEKSAAPASARKASRKGKKFSAPESTEQKEKKKLLEGLSQIKEEDV